MHNNPNPLVTTGGLSTRHVDAKAGAVGPGDACQVDLWTEGSLSTRITWSRHKISRDGHSLALILWIRSVTWS